MKNDKPVANQKTIIIRKAAIDDNTIYTKIRNDILFVAMRSLKSLELKVFLYLASNQDGYSFALSSEHISSSVKADKRKIQLAINGLIEKELLIQVPDTENTYVFEEKNLLCPKRP